VHGDEEEQELPLRLDDLGSEFSGGNEFRRDAADAVVLMQDELSAILSSSARPSAPGGDRSVVGRGIPSDLHVPFDSLERLERTGAQADPRGGSAAAGSKTKTHISENDELVVSVSSGGMDVKHAAGHYLGKVGHELDVVGRGDGNESKQRRSGKGKRNSGDAVVALALENAQLIRARELLQLGLLVDLRHGPLYHAYGNMELVSRDVERDRVYSYLDWLNLSNHYECVTLR